LGIFLVAAVAFGLAASFLAGPSTPFEAQAPPSPPTNFLYVQIASAIILLALVGFVVFRIISTFRRGGLPIPVHTMVLFLTMFGVALVFLVLFHLVGGGATTAVANGTAKAGSPPPPPPNAGPSGPAVGNFTGFGGVSIPGWVVYAGVIGAALVVVTVLVPYVIAARKEPIGALGTPRPTVEEVRAALQRAIDDLDAPSVSANRRIIAAYAALLQRFEERRPRGVDGAVDTMTPRDVERVCIERLRVEPSTARELTGLFEEARYSTHPMEEPDVERARAALRRALTDLDRAPRLP
jgi:hypothetical protein